MKSILELTLRNNGKYTFVTEKTVAESMAAHHAKGGVFFEAGAGHCMSVDYKNVIAVQVTPVETVPKAAGVPAIKAEPAPGKPENPVNLPEAAKTAEKNLFKLVCKCGAGYFAYLFEDTVKCRCNECGETLYVDRFAPRVTGDNGRTAILATNKYRVMVEDKS